MSVTVLVVAALLLAAGSGGASREHKVHNIVLYPDKQSWCKTTAIKQVVGMPGYQPLTIDNNVCVGACFSYSIPSSEPAEPGELIRPYCDSCQPLTTRCYHVTLQPDESEGERDVVQKRVQIIDECACLRCGGNSGGGCDENESRTSELPEQLLSGEKHHNHNHHQHQHLHHHHQQVAAEDPPATTTATEKSMRPDALLETEAAGGATEEEDSGGSAADLNEAPLRELLLARHRHLGLGEHSTHVAHGPHGSLVLVPESVEVDAAELRPAHEGTVISYQPHHHPTTDE